MKWSTPIEAALSAPHGARFYKCALQVNPFQYVLDNAKTTAFTDEASYNAAIVAALADNGIEVVAVTDHYRIQTSLGLWKAAATAGVIVLPGFEAVTKGVSTSCAFSIHPRALTPSSGRSELVVSMATEKGRSAALTLLNYLNAERTGGPPSLQPTSPARVDC